MNKRLRVQ